MCCKYVPNSNCHSYNSSCTKVRLNIYPLNTVFIKSCVHVIYKGHNKSSSSYQCTMVCRVVGMKLATVHIKNHRFFNSLTICRISRFAVWFSLFLSNKYCNENVFKIKTFRIPLIFLILLLINNIKLYCHITCTILGTMIQH